MKSFNPSRYKSDLSRYRIECARKMTGKVLDMGGGLGIYLPYFNSEDITVLDISKEALERLEWSNKVLADACHTPFEDDTFDSIWACSCVQYMDSIEEFLKEALRILKKDTEAKIMVMLPNPDSVWNKIKRCMGMRSWEDDEAQVFHLYKADELKKYGTLTGEVRFLPKVFDDAVRKVPFLWHTMMLEVHQSTLLGG